MASYIFLAPLRGLAFTLPLLFCLTGSMPNKSASARGNQTNFLNYQLVVIKACCIHFTPLFLVFTQSCAKTVMVDVKLAITGGLRQRFGLPESLPMQDPGPKLLGRT